MQLLTNQDSFAVLNLIIRLRDQKLKKVLPATLSTTTASDAFLDVERSLVTVRDQFFPSKKISNVGFFINALAPKQ